MTVHRPLLSGCTPLLAQGACELWRVDLDTGVGLGVDVDPEVDPDVLSASERARALRFAFARDRRRYLKGRFVLRQLLASKLGASAASLQLQEGAQGKPFVQGAPHCRFNVSHSGAVGLIGIGNGSCTSSDIGVDIETRHYAPDFETMAGTILTVQERRQLRALEPGQRCEALLFAWTRKEACVKAIGTGLNIAPNSFATGFSGNCQIRISDQGTTHVLQLQTIEAGADVIASLAHLN